MKLTATINGQTAEVEMPQAEAVRLFRGELAGLMAELRDEVKQLAAKLASPYRDRQGAAAYINKSVSYVDNLMAEGRVSKKLIGSTPLIPVADLERVIKEDTESQAKARVSPRVFTKAA